jgi:hypothetical protein
MSYWNDLTHFLYGRGFWYADPVREADGLTDEQLLWVPDANSLPIIWQVGHVAHRERFHIGVFLQGLSSDVIPDEMQVYGADWVPVDEIKKGPPPDEVFAWARAVRDESHRYIDTLKPEDFAKVTPDAGDRLPVGHWLFITVAHTALHIGRIQMLRALIEGTKERAC